MLCLIAVGLLVARMVVLARADPIERHFHYRPRDWPAGAKPLRLVLVTDTHASLPDTPSARLARVIAQVNALKPDVVLLGGDYIGDRKAFARAVPVTDAVAPFAKLRPPLGVFAVTGNHDESSDLAAVTLALEAVGVTVLDGTAARAGPLSIGGLAFHHGHRREIVATAAAMRAIGGVPIFLAHTPDFFVGVPPDIGLTLAGHTHCGQIAPPLIGPLLTASRYGRRFACGIIVEDGHRLIVSGGVGTSMLPIRLGAPPDIWVIDID